MYIDTFLPFCVIRCITHKHTRIHAHMTRIGLPESRIGLPHRGDGNKQLNEFKCGPQVGNH